MSKGIFYITRNISGREGKGLIPHIKLIESNNTEIDFLTELKTNKSKKFIEDIIGIPVKLKNHYLSFYENEAKHMSNWMEVYEKLDIRHLQDYDDLYIMGGIDLFRSNLIRGSKRNFVFPYDKHQMKFYSTGIKVIHLLALLKAHNEYNIPLHEMAFDPNEMSMDLVHSDVKPNSNYYLYHGYDIPNYNIKRLDSLQYFYNNPTPSLFQNDYTEKPNDYTFGFTVLEKSEREDYVDYVNRMALNFKTSNVYCKNYITGQNTLLDRDNYISMISLSRFTTILPAYDSTCFSVYRLIESLQHNCLPLIHKSCNIEDIQKSFNVDLTPLVTETPMNESDRLELLDYMKQNILKVERSFER